MDIPPSFGKRYTFKYRICGIYEQEAYGVF